MGNEIKTTYDPKPIPIRNFDYCADDKFYKEVADTIDNVGSIQIWTTY